MTGTNTKGYNESKKNDMITRARTEAITKLIIFSLK